MLELKDICKTFNPNTINAKVALNHLNLTLNDGDFVTVIGGNGAGKSTMLNAIAGVFQVDSGTITIDGQDVTKLPEHKRAAFLGRVFQDPMMGTAPDMQLEENLALAYRRGKKLGLRWHINREERDMYRERLRELNLGLEDRLTTKVGLLSGGQRQRVSLARAFLKDAPILVLDEATASLDMKSEELIQKEIEKLASGRTTFIIAHRFSTIRMADRILVLEGGRIAADGTHEELMEKSPLYRDLYTKQQMIAEEEGGTSC